MITKRASIVIAVAGLPGSGKTYFAQRLAEKLGAQHISSDALRKQLFPSPTYHPTEKQAVYQQLLAMAQRHLTRGTDTILDATFHKQERREWITSELARNGHVPYWMVVQADENTTLKRVSKKREDSDADWEVYQKLQLEWDDFVFPHKLLQSTQHNIDEMLQKALEYIAKHD